MESVSRRKFLQAASAAALSTAAIACFGCSASTGSSGAAPSGAAPSPVSSVSSDSSSTVGAVHSAPSGAIVEFGHWEQDGDVSNGAEPIEWMVLDEKDGYRLLISKYILAPHPYNDESVDITWEDCTLRAWLNGEFYEEAFTEDERNAIQLTSLSNPDNPGRFGTEGGNDTQDRVFLLSIDEAEQYFADDGACACEPTQAVLDEGIWVFQDNGCSHWWLRSPGDDASFAAHVAAAGFVSPEGLGVDNSRVGVRPALWV